MKAGWTEVALGEVCEISIGKTPPRADAASWGGDRPWLSIADMNQGRDLVATAECVTDSAITKYNLRSVEPGTVLLSFKLSIGKVGVARVPMFTNEAIAHLKISSTRLDSSYLYWALRGARQLTRGADRAAMGETLNLPKVRALPIPLPPLDEQRRIAAILDQADELRAKRRQAIAHLDTLTEAIFLDMFGDRRSEPGHWPTRPLGDLVRTPIVRGIDQPGDHDPDGVPYLKTTDFRAPVVDRSNLARASADVSARSPRSIVEQGDLVLCIRATVGPVMEITAHLAGVNLTRGTARIAPGNEIETQYLLASLRSRAVQSQLSEKLRGATFLQIPLADVRTLQIAVPALELQRTFGDLARRSQSLLNRANSSLAHLDELFASLQARAFAGEL